MRKPYRIFMLASLVMAAGCTDRIVGPSTPTPEDRGVVALDVGEPPAPGVGTMGVIEVLKPQDQGLVLDQLGFDYVPPPGAKFREARHEFAVGSKHNRLQVHIKKDTTKIYLDGVEKTFADLAVGDTVLIVGRVTGASLHADIVSDFTGVGAPVDSIVDKLPKENGQLVSRPIMGANLAAATTSLCMGQDLDYSDSNILEFQGCWGGPSASDDLNTPFIPLFCPLIGCFGIDRFSYTMAVGGWGFAFPFKFKAQASPGLVYHVPGNVSLGVEPLPATVGSFSFAGGLGIDFGLNIDFCSFFGCYDVHTFHLSAFSMIHQATAAGPLEGRMEIGEPSCPSVGVIPVDIPINPLAIGLCEDLGLNGKAFNTTVTSSGASPAVWSRRAFFNASQTAVVRPDAMSVGMRFDDFDWRPGMTMGLYFRFLIFSVPVWNTPSIPFGEVGLFDAVTNPFPLPGSVFSVATDPLSPVGDLRYLFQPTEANLTLSVAPAQTVVELTSEALLVEGTPVTARLGEQYDNSAIAGQTITIVATGLNGTANVSMSAATNSAGVASVILPVGEYNVTASYAGATTYLPSSDNMTPVYVYRPTTFVIWGANPGGVVVGGRHAFWGQGWAKQVTNGSFTGNSSFQGFAIPTSATSWVSPPASSGRGPEMVPDLIGVIIATEVQDRGSRATGNIAGHAVLRVDDPASYRSDGGHGAAGVVRAKMP